jgi:hypothetical protein
MMQMNELLIQTEVHYLIYRGKNSDATTKKDDSMIQKQRSRLIQSSFRKSMNWCL